MGLPRFSAFALVGRCDDDKCGVWGLHPEDRMGLHHRVASVARGWALQMQRFSSKQGKKHAVNLPFNLRGVLTLISTLFLAMPVAWLKWKLAGVVEDFWTSQFLGM